MHLKVAHSKNIFHVEVLYVSKLSLLACGLLTVTVEGVVARERTVVLQDNSEDTHRMQS